MSRKTQDRGEVKRKCRMNQLTFVTGHFAHFDFMQIGSFYCDSSIFIYSDRVT